MLINIANYSWDISRIVNLRIKIRKKSCRLKPSHITFLSSELTRYAIARQHYALAPLIACHIWMCGGCFGLRFLLEILSESPLRGKRKNKFKKRSYLHLCMHVCFLKLSKKNCPLPPRTLHQANPIVSEKRDPPAQTLIGLRTAARWVYTGIIK